MFLLTVLEDAHCSSQTFEDIKPYDTVQRLELYNFQNSTQHHKLDMLCASAFQFCNIPDRVIPMICYQSDA